MLRWSTGSKSNRLAVLTHLKGHLHRDLLNNWMAARALLHVSLWSPFSLQVFAGWQEIKLSAAELVGWLEAQWQ